MTGEARVTAHPLPRRRRRSRRGPAAAAGALATALLAAAVTGCAADPGAAGAASGSDGGAQGATLTVLAAASLTDAFTELGETYRADHPGAEVTFSFAGSQALAAQIEQGAPADVIATADTATMDRLEAADLVGEPAVFARNELAVVVRPGNPEGITGLADLARDDLDVVLAAPEVPAGGYAQQALTAAGVSVTPRSLEQDVRSVLTRVRLGEADAGIVYRTDAVAAGEEVTRVDVPAEQNVSAAYPAATVRSGDHPEAAQEFVDWLSDAEAQDVLREYGFTAP
ncbi:molybdate ABC transporter substrate-binding protein [Allostreptomyces psammosilenae]|uniref:Molybdate transport system substrate-binding protein n=1 Tax=Allostreptomyces psammosilenae TaxID=1892865 RepID=A0A853AC50_9ACTN|nr:molybdate ABC transporter substrate-binding protein [Allostreptomyces psammosilenae]NYI08048.1 molybdate transport system substrate-binding protein [Allostreptomyces psammosilenae]